MKMKQKFLCWLIWLLVLLLVAPPGLLAQDSKAGAPASEANEAAPQFKPEELDQMLAPIALYPDSLLAQVLMAATYPLEVVQAARWVNDNKDLKDDQLGNALEKKDWDPSVKSLVPFPQVLSMMNEKLEWTQKLGDAFLAQQADVMDSVQRLRAQAQAAGNLKTTPEQKVIVEKKIIVIQPTTQVVYVPTYNPVVVYGVWAYPAYPPYPVYPPGYVAATAAISFGVGVAVGAAMYGGFRWGGGGYGHGNVYVNNSVNVNRNFNQVNVNKTNINQANVQNWQHNPEHRKGAQYPNQATAQRYNQSGAARPQTQQNPAARGYGQGGMAPQAQGATQRPAGTGAGIQTQGGTQRPGGTVAGQRPAGTGAGIQSQGAGQRPSGTGAGVQSQGASQRSTSPGAFSGAGNGASERASSARGQSSRGGASASTAGGRSGGGASRGGGGRGR